MIEKTRRVVTGFDADGKSIVAIDGPPGSLSAHGGGLGEVWVTDGIADNSIKGDLAKRPVILEPPAGGSVCRFFVVEPEDKKLSAKNSRSRPPQDSKRSEASIADPIPRAVRGCIRRALLTMSSCLTARSRLILDKGEVALKPFDVVVQRGTNHAWVNRGSKRALLVAVLIDAKPLPGKSDNRG